MSRKYYLPVLALLIVALTHFFPGCDELVTEVTKETVIQWVRADFTADKESGCAPLTVQFTDHSGGEPNSFLWQFGDGGSSLERNPEYTYDSGGVFDCTLTVFDTMTGSQDTEIKKRFIIVGTTMANFVADPDTACVGQEVTFTPSGFGMITQWRWDLGDTIVTDSNPNPVAHVYDTAGTYTVKLTVIDSCGTKTDSNLMLVWDCPTVIFFADSTVGCVPFDVIFFDSSVTGSTQAIASRSWDFGNGQTSTAQNDTVTYDSAGVYTVKLTVTDSQGATSTDSIVGYITAYGTPSAQFSALTDTQACFSQFQQFLVKFNNESVGDTSLTWHFGDGTISNDTNPVHAYVVPGFYTVMLKVEGPCGIDSVTRDSFVILSDTLKSDSVGFTISPTTGDTTTVFTFIDTSSGFVTGWSWEFGDDSTATGDSVSHTYTFADTFEVRLTISNDCGTVVAVDTVIVTEP